MSLWATRDLRSQGDPLTIEVWERRHRTIVVLLWMHVAGLSAYGILSGFGLLHSMARVATVAGAAVLAMRAHGRTVQSVAASVGLLASSAILVQLSGGAIQMHFHFFVMVSAIGLYQSWAPLFTAVAYVLAQLGILGVTMPDAVFNGDPSVQRPWIWAALQAAFVAVTCVVSLIAGRANEVGLRDPLTSLPTRILLYDRLQQALTRARRNRIIVAVLALDLDGFKDVNHTLGHAAGDKVLADVAARLGGKHGESDTIARVGGNKFVLLFETADSAGAVRAVERVQKSLSAPFVVDGREFTIGATIGIATSGGEHDPDQLVSDAELALHAAKDRRSRDCYVVFSDNLRERVEAELFLPAQLTRALRNREFEVWFQPIVDVQTSEVVSAEALLRWNSADGPVSPQAFLPIAEKSGLIVPIGRWVLQEACRWATGWQEAVSPFRVAINVSGRQLQDPGFVNDVAAALAETGLEPSRLTIELTESFLVEDKDAAAAVLEELKALGVGLAIDDFGTGYSSLSYVQRFPIDVLKIDKAFIDPIADGPEESGLARAIVMMGHAMGLAVVAEGVETAGQAAILADMGCDFVQGYYFSKPVRAEAMRFRVPALHRRRATRRHTALSTATVRDHLDRNPNLGAPAAMLTVGAAAPDEAIEAEPGR